MPEFSNLRDMYNYLTKFFPTLTEQLTSTLIRLYLDELSQYDSACFILRYMPKRVKLVPKNLLQKLDSTVVDKMAAGKYHPDYTAIAGMLSVRTSDVKRRCGYVLRYMCSLLLISLYTSYFAEEREAEIPDVPFNDVRLLDLIYNDTVRTSLLRNSQHELTVGTVLSCTYKSRLELKGFGDKTSKYVISLLKEIMGTYFYRTTLGSSYSALK